jgi:hypothetical protein
MNKWKRVLVSLGCLAVIATGTLALVSGPSFTAQAAPPCPVQCKKEYKQCVRFCGQPDVYCFASCETVLEICLANCGSITQ